MPSTSPLLARGVYEAPALGPHGETIYFAVDDRHREVARRFVANPLEAPAAVRELERAIAPLRATG